MRLRGSEIRTLLPKPQKPVYTFAPNASFRQERSDLVLPTVNAQNDINAAINSLIGSEGVIAFRPGTIQLDGPINLQTLVSLEGSGINSTYFRNRAAGQPAFTNATGANVNFAKLRDFSILKAAGIAVGNALNLPRFNSGVLDNIRIIGEDSGIPVGLYLSAAYSNILRNLEVFECTVGVRLNGDDVGSVNDNLFHGLILGRNVTIDLDLITAFVNHFTGLFIGDAAGTAATSVQIENCGQLIFESIFCGDASRTAYDFRIYGGAGVRWSEEIVIRNGELNRADQVGAIALYADYVRRLVVEKVLFTNNTEHLRLGSNIEDFRTDGPAYRVGVNGGELYAFWSQPRAGQAISIGAGQSRAQGGAELLYDEDAYGGVACELDAANQVWTLSIKTQSEGILPQGDYVLRLWMRDTNAVEDDLHFYMRNVTDAVYRINILLPWVLSTGYCPYDIPFSVIAGDAGDELYWKILKDSTTANGIRVSHAQIIRLPAQRAQHVDIFMDVLANTANHVVAAQDLTVATPIACAIAAQPDVPRNVTIAITDIDVSISAFDIQVVGVDAKGNVMKETFTFAGGLNQTGSVAFATITSVTVNSITGANAGDVLNMGIGSRLGLCDSAYAAGDIFKVKKNNANYPAASYTVSLGPGLDTVDVSTGGAIIAGDDFTIWFQGRVVVS